MPAQTTKNRTAPKRKELNGVFGWWLMPNETEQNKLIDDFTKHVIRGNLKNIARYLRSSSFSS
jgi:hypothetical protein